VGRRKGQKWHLRQKKTKGEEERRVNEKALRKRIRREKTTTKRGSKKKNHIGKMRGSGKWGGKKFPRRKKKLQVYEKGEKKDNIPNEEETTKKRG